MLHMYGMRIKPPKDLTTSLASLSVAEKAIAFFIEDENFFINYVVIALLKL